MMRVLILLTTLFCLFVFGQSKNLKDPPVLKKGGPPANLAEPLAKNTKETSHLEKTPPETEDLKQTDIFVLLAL